MSSLYYASTDLDEIFTLVIDCMDDQHKEMLLRLLGVTKDGDVFIVPAPAIEFVQQSLDRLDCQLTPDYCEQQFQEEYDRHG